MSDVIQFDYKDHWKIVQINLERPNSADESLGFTIAGGIDKPFLNDHFTSIIVTHITENSLVYKDKQLKLYDIILRVNDIDFRNVKHRTALSILRKSGWKVQLVIRRLSPSISEEIELEHNGKLGISIAGGIGSEYFQTDHGVFIMDINKSQTNRQVDIGDRLLQISSNSNTYDLRFVTHETARKYIQLACTESPKIKLYVGHTRPIQRKVTTASDVIDLTADGKTNHCTDNLKNKDHHTNSKINDSHKNNTVNPESIEQLKLKETTIAYPTLVLCDGTDDSITNRSSDEINRTNSIAVYDRQSNDEINAEKLFHSIISFCRQNKIDFIDDQFLPSSCSIGDNNHSYQWLKIIRAHPHGNWTVYSSPNPSDIQQGYLGNCWLMAALTLITERPEMLEHILLTKTINEEGVYLIRLCYNGLWNIILIDDYFPCTEYGELAYAKARHSQLYVPLIEKACAKLFGSYAGLHGGRTEEGLQLLTGAPSDRIELDLNDSLLNQDLIWAKLLSACESNLLIGASTGRKNVSEEEYKRIHISMNHGFSILAAHYLTDIAMEFVLVRDPHGRAGYEEELITSSILTQLNSIVKTHLPSGAFWISWPVFLQYFRSITISSYTTDAYDIRQVSQFTQSSTESIPTFYFYISEKTLVDISLNYHKKNRRVSYSHTQSFILCQIDDTVSRKLHMDTMILKTRCGVFVHWNGLLKPGFYILIPFSISFWDENSLQTNRNYTLVIYSKIPINGRFITEPILILTDCLISYCLKNCSKLSKHKDFNCYVTNKQSGMMIFIAENLSSTDYLNINIDMSTGICIRSSRPSMIIHDCIPPHHRQILFLTESTNDPNQATQMKYVYNYSHVKQANNSKPNINLFENDFHSYRSF